MSVPQTLLVQLQDAFCGISFHHIEFFTYFGFLETLSSFHWSWIVSMIFKPSLTKVICWLFHLCTYLLQLIRLNNEVPKLDTRSYLSNGLMDQKQTWWYHAIYSICQVNPGDLAAMLDFKERFEHFFLQNKFSRAVPWTKPNIHYIIDFSNCGNVCPSQPIKMASQTAVFLISWHQAWYMDFEPDFQEAQNNFLAV